MHYCFLSHNVKALMFNLSIPKYNTELFQFFKLLFPFVVFKAERDDLAGLT